ncbi:MAG: tRNA (adenosine(37)-N6)-threonylcarbamoyltransferase complex dimerization subunit type 1 TsaB [Melioribacteraceae bacterium]|nr:tRNA (adenosine(37)-N6)-threonylcarbamoyltransferase complex dimerization subunit type 1 TsaB [Melioribacteraceae bacterium]
MNKNFPILAIETTSDLCSVAVLFNDNNYIEINYLAKHIHSEKLMNMVSQVVEESKIDIKDFSSIAVSIGPGSFTGLRIGLSAAKGIAFGANLPICPVPTFNALAFQISNYVKHEQEFSILFQASIDDFYYGKYKLNQSEILEIINCNLVDKSTIFNFIINGDLVFGNGKLPELTIRKIFPSALSIAKWSNIFGKDLLTFNYENLEPEYVKQFVGRIKK